MTAPAQLDLFGAAAPAIPPEPALHFVRQPVLDREGLHAYLHLVRAPTDPERRAPRGAANADRAPHLTIARTTRRATWRAAILDLLADGNPRTFNRMAVELSGYNADVLFCTAADHALWDLVDDGAVEMTLSAPVLFRLAP